MSSYLHPTSAPPADDLDLDILLQQVVKNILNVDGRLVRPRWQAEAPPQPSPSSDWFSIGVMREFPDANVAWMPHPTDDTKRVQRRQWELEVVFSAYGPNASRNCTTLQNGLLVQQNISHLRPYKLNYVGCNDSVLVPELINGKWVRRVDLALVFRRQLDTTYAIPSVAVVPPIPIASIP